MKVECFPTNYTRVTWARGAHGTITITFLDTGDSYYWYLGQWKLSALTRALREAEVTLRAALLKRADELERAIQQAEQ